MSARETALNVLIACRKDDAWSNGVLKEYIRRDRLDRREAALASRLCYGVLQNRGKLDFYLKQLLTGKLRDLHPAVRDILHLGLYQIYEMDKIPGSAAVNESVDLTKKYCKKLRNAPGLVNAVLRSALRTKGTLKEPTSLADRYSHPQKLIDLLRGYIGKEKLEAMLQANNTVAPMTVQVNTLRTTAAELTEELTRAGVEVQLHGWLPDCLILSGTVHGHLLRHQLVLILLFHGRQFRHGLGDVHGCIQNPTGAGILTGLLAGSAPRSRAGRAGQLVAGTRFYRYPHSWLLWL